MQRVAHSKDGEQCKSQESFLEQFPCLCGSYADWWKFEKSVVSNALVQLGVGHDFFEPLITEQSVITM